MRHRRYDRRTATRVRHGKVQKKNRVALSALQKVTIDRESPRNGYRHLVSKRDVQDFIELIPEWPELSEGLEAIWLGRGEAGTDGYYEQFPEGTGRIVIHAWPEDLWQEIEKEAFLDHKPILDRIGVSWDKTKAGYLCRFTESQGKAYILLHVLMHELGHHRDAMLRKKCQSGEGFAEDYANRRFEELFEAYLGRFGRP